MIDIPLLLSICFSSICIVSLFLGIYTLYTNPKDRTNRLFLRCRVLVHMVLWLCNGNISTRFNSMPVLEKIRGHRMGSFKYPAPFHDGSERQGILLNRWWKYVLLYLPAVVCITVFSYIPWLNPQQYNLVLTELGWVNVSIKNFWDWIFILYYISYSMATIFLIWKWRESASSKNVRKQSVIVLRAFIITLILGVFTESVVNNVFSIRIPQPSDYHVASGAVHLVCDAEVWISLYQEKCNRSLLFGTQIRQGLYITFKLSVCSQYIKCYHNVFSF